MAKCWIIEQGSYSDYRVVGIFTSQENAERICALINEKETWDKASVRERILDPAIAQLNDGLSRYLVQFTHDGRADVEPKSPIDSDENPESEMHWNTGDIYFVFAKSAEHALKIGADRHAQWAAEKAGIA